MTARPIVVAHRGASRAFAENTLDAFRGARDLGADWVELDARRTSDGAVVVHHDPAVPGHPAFIVETPAAELPASIPTLADALAVGQHAEPPLGVNIEIKSAPDEPDYDPDHWLAAEVVSIIHAAGAGEVLVTSFDPGAINRVHEIDPAIPTGFLVADLGELDAIVARTVAHGHVALNPWQWAMREEVVTVAHDAGLAVNVWTVDDPEVMTTLAGWGVDAIITNVPDVARAALG
jgi:glycerophosphoryl diester phosphodiesterase